MRTPPRTPPQKKKIQPPPSIETFFRVSGPIIPPASLSSSSSGTYREARRRHHKFQKKNKKKREKKTNRRNGAHTKAGQAANPPRTAGVPGVHGRRLRHVPCVFSGLCCTGVGGRGSGGVWGGNRTLKAPGGRDIHPSIHRGSDPRFSSSHARRTSRGLRSNTLTGGATPRRFSVSTCHRSLDPALIITQK